MWWIKLWIIEIMEFWILGSCMRMPLCGDYLRFSFKIKAVL